MNKKSAQKNSPHLNSRRLTIIIVFISVIVGAGLYVTQGHRSGNSTPDASDVAVDSSVQRGMVLASQNCGSCHMLPEPSLLSKSAWENVLPKMGLRLGIKYHNGISYQSSDPAAAQEESRILPAGPVLDDVQWQDILNYYTNAAPDALSLLPGRSLPNLTSFAITPPPAESHKQRSMITYVKIDNSVKPARIFAFELFSSRLLLLNAKLEIMDAVHVDGIIVNMTFHKGQILAVSMGPRMNLRDSERLGKILPLKVSNGKMQILSPLFQNLARPLDILPMDVNGDGREDYVISEFGHLTGQLSWMENKGSGVYNKHILRNLPGSIKVISKINQKTARPDLWVLFGQGEEGIFHFINEGAGKFITKQVLRVPPVYGSSSFDLVDIDKDGLEDLIYTCGDNGDYSKILKPYHGVYIYKNNGDDNFTQSYFYPINGCYKAITGDFRGKGNTDLAVIAFFTNPSISGESFTYLENSGGFNFKPLSLPADQRFESLLTMDAGDADNDGKTDLILGNAFPFPGVAVSTRTEPMFVILKNTAK